MPTMTNLEKLKSAVTLWNDSKGGRFDGWTDLVHDDFTLMTSGEAAEELEFAARRNSKAEMMDYLRSLTDHWSMIHYTGETYLTDGDNVAMFGNCAWTHRTTGKFCESRVAMLWTFRDGKAIRLVEVFDSAAAVAAATP